jgi:hypothetical protein
MERSGGMHGYSGIQALDVLSRLLDVEMCPFFSVNQMERTETCIVIRRQSWTVAGSFLTNKDTEWNSKKVDLHGRGQIEVPR